jgi:hypothetical protein
MPPYTIADPHLGSYAQDFQKMKISKKINSMLMERDILHKHKIENRSKKSFEIFILYHL